jgi:hypothetical protein
MHLSVIYKQKCILQNTSARILITSTTYKNPKLETTQMPGKGWIIHTRDYKTIQISDPPTTIHKDRGASHEHSVSKRTWGQKTKDPATQRQDSGETNHSCAIHLWIGFLICQSRRRWACSDCGNSPIHTFMIHEHFCVSIRTFKTAWLQNTPVPSQPELCNHSHTL